MNKKTIIAILFILFSSSVFAQLTPVDSTITGTITGTLKLDAAKKYLLNGFVKVDSTAKLYIPAGTKIFGGFPTDALIVKRGGQIFATGEPGNPVIFTSRQPAGLRGQGDWGGVIILGRAPVNKSGGDPTGNNNVLIEGGVGEFFGGSVPTDNSGIFKYVRIEYCGAPFQPNDEINGLTMGGVGSGTEIHHVQVSYSLDDSFEWFGGTVNHTHLIAFKGLDDDFDTDFGYSGKVQWGISYRDPRLADQSKSEAFESDGNGSDNTATPRTTVNFSNITAIGPRTTATDPNFNPLYFHAIHHRRGSQMRLYNSVLQGYDEGGIYVDGNTTLGDMNTNTFVYKGVLLAGVSPVISTTNSSLLTNYSGDPNNWFNNAGWDNSSVAQPADVMLTDPFNYIKPNLTPMTGSPVLGASNLADLTDPFWTSTSYIGAFGDDGDRWDLEFANYDPQGVVWQNGVDWTATILLVTPQNESRYAVLGRAASATDGIDASYGETILPPASPGADLRWILPGGVSQTALDLRDDAAAITSLTYTLRVDPGVAGTTRLVWDDSKLAGGSFTLSDGLSGLLFPDVDMRAQNSVTFTATGATETVYTFTITVATKFNVTIGVNDQWNLASFPGVNPAGMTPAILFPNYNNTFAVSGYSPSLGYTILSTITPKRGFWINHNGNRNYSYSNVNYTSTTPIDVETGWNLIGTGEYVSNASDVTTVPSNIQNGLLFGYSSAGGYTVATQLQTGKGYWINVLSNGKVILPAASGLPKDIMEEIIDSEWGKIVITDAKGSSYVLYSANGTSNLDYYNLPPLPPAGLFDIRYSSDRFAEDLSSAQNINLNGVTYPVTVSVEGMNLVLEDASNSSVRFELNSGDQVTLNKTAANSLRVQGENTSTLPDSYDLSQNYPNPFNPSTTIKFSIPEAANVKLVVYNSLGQQVAELLNSNLAVGKYEVTWNASNISSGVYFYKLHTDNFTSIKKMMLLK